MQAFDFVLEKNLITTKESKFFDFIEVSFNLPVLVLTIKNPPDPFLMGAALVNTRLTVWK